MTTESFKWDIGNGSTIRFWKDCWLGSNTMNKTFPRLFNLAVDKDITVEQIKSCWRNESSLLWRRNLRGWEIDSASNLGIIVSHINLSNSKDKVKWTVNNSDFSVKDVYANLELSNQKEGPWSLI